MSTIQKGSILIYRVFDIAEEIDFSKVESLLQSSPPIARLRLSRTQRHEVVMRNAPLQLQIGKGTFTLGETTYTSDNSIKLWDYGVMSFTMSIAIAPGSTWEELTELAKKIEGTKQLDDIARHESRELTRTLRGALKEPHEWEVFEDYSVFLIESHTGPKKAAELMNTFRPVNLVLAEPVEHLSEKTKDILSQSTFQYTENDYTIIDWNSALVIDPSGTKDIPDVLEFALTQLMELRYYDDLLDDRLESLYDSIENAKRRWNFLGNDSSKLSEEASVLYIEFSEFLERVDNSLKVVGDFFLATVFRGAVKRFRFLDWQQSITRKMSVVAQLTQLIQGEVQASRSHFLEIIVIILIAIEIISAFFRGEFLTLH